MSATITVLPTRLAREFHDQAAEPSRLERAADRSLRMIDRTRSEVADGVADFERIARRARRFVDQVGGGDDAA